MFDNTNPVDEVAITKSADMTAAKTSNITPASHAENHVLSAQAQALAAVQAQHALNVERITAHRQPVQPGKMASHSQPDIPYYGHPCAVKGCKGHSEGAYATVSPKETFIDPVTVRTEPLPDEDWERQAFTNAEETKLRALGYSSDLISQIENATRFVGNAPMAQQFVSTAILPLCAYHNEHHQETLNSGWKNGALPVQFGYQR